MRISAIVSRFYTGPAAVEAQVGVLVVGQFPIIPRLSGRNTLQSARIMLCLASQEETWFRGNVELSFIEPNVMQFLTRQETYDWLEKTPLIVQRDRNDLSFPKGPTFCFKLELPSKIYRASNFVNYLLPYRARLSIVSFAPLVHRLGHVE